MSLREEGTLRDLIARLAEEAGGELEAVSQQIREDSYAGFIIVVNGTNARSLKGLDTPIGDEDTVSILPVVAGGGAAGP